MLLTMNLPESGHVSRAVKRHGYQLKSGGIVVRD